MEKTVRVPGFVRVQNAVVGALTRLGVPLRGVALLTVRGRKSGQPRSTPVVIITQNGKRYVVAAYGVVDWVRNLRAAGAGTLTRSRRTEEFTAVEAPPDEAAPILKLVLESGPAFLRRYYTVTASSSLADYAREAVRHPVFQIVTAPGAKPSV